MRRGIWKVRGEEEMGALKCSLCSQDRLLGRWLLSGLKQVRDLNMRLSGEVLQPGGRHTQKPDLSRLLQCRTGSLNLLWLQLGVTHVTKVTQWVSQVCWCEDLRSLLRSHPKGIQKLRWRRLTLWQSLSQSEEQLWDCHSVCPLGVAPGLPSSNA